MIGIFSKTSGRRCWRSLSAGSNVSIFSFNRRSSYSSTQEWGSAVGLEVPPDLTFEFSVLASSDTDAWRVQLNKRRSLNDAGGHARHHGSIPDQALETL